MRTSGFITVSFLLIFVQYLTDSGSRARRLHIRVNSIAPGVFKSEITEDLVRKNGLKNVAMKSIPLRTFGTSDPALTSLIRYLIHDSSKYVSANIFIVDAGYSLPAYPIFSSLEKKIKKIPLFEGKQNIC